MMTTKGVWMIEEGEWVTEWEESESRGRVRRQKGGSRGLGRPKVGWQRFGPLRRRDSRRGFRAADSGEPQASWNTWE